MKWAAPTDRHILASKQIRQDKYDDIETNNTTKRNETKRKPESYEKKSGIQMNSRKNLDEK